MACSDDDDDFDYITVVVDGEIYIKSTNKQQVSFSYDPTIQSEIFIKSRHGTYVTEKKNKITCSNKECSNNTHFISIPVGKDNVALLASNNMYVCVEKSGKLNANRIKRKKWETFKLEKHNGKFAFLSWRNRYLSARPTGFIRADRPHVKPSELFEIGVCRIDHGKKHNLYQRVQSKVQKEMKHITQQDEQLIYGILKSPDKINKNTLAKVGIMGKSAIIGLLPQKKKKRHKSAKRVLK